MSHTTLVFTVLNAACISPTRYTGSNSHIIISDCHTATIALAQPMDSLSAEQYTVTLTRNGQQSDCQSYVDNVNMATSSDSVLFEGLEENSVYSVKVIAITFNLTRSVNVADITTLTAGEYTRSYIIHICYLIDIIYIYIYIYIYTAPSAAPRDLTSHIVNSENITLTWRNINCIQRSGIITIFDVQYGQVDGALTTMRIGSSDTTRYIVIGLLPFTEYRFQIAGVNSHGPGPYTAFIGPIKTNDDDRLKFNLAMILCITYNSLT